MKTQNLSSEQNGISIAVNVGTDKPVYASPAQLRGLLENATKLKAELESIDEEVLAAIDERAGQTPEARKSARNTAKRAQLQAAVANTTGPAHDIAVMQLKLFELQTA